VRNWFAAIVLLAVACGNESLPYPVARLEVPKCAVVGKTITLDASASETPSDAIVRYAFRVGHNGAWLISGSAKLDFRFGKPEMLGDKLSQTVVLLEVQDDRGRTAQDAALTWVVFDESQCPEGTVPPPTPDVVTEDVLSDGVSEDVPEPDGLQNELGPAETDGTAPPLDLAPDGPFDAGPGCPSIDGTWQLAVYCGGSVKVELELSLMQNADCTFADNLGVLTGTVHPDGTVDLDSDNPQLFMDDCFGKLEESEVFTVDCASGCTVQFVKVP